MGGHQSRRGQIRHGYFDRMKTVHVPRNRRSAERKFELSAIGSGFFFATRTKAPPKRVAEPNSPAVKEPPPHLSGEVQSCVQYGVLQYPPRLFRREILGSNK